MKSVVNSVEIAMVMTLVLFGVFVMVLIMIV
jgi:hypothetical protein